MERDRKPVASIRTKNEEEHVLVDELGFATGKGYFVAFLVGAVVAGLFSGVGWLVSILTGWDDALGIGVSIGGILGMLLMFWLISAFEPF